MISWTPWLRRKGNGYGVSRTCTLGLLFIRYVKDFPWPIPLSCEVNLCMYVPWILVMIKNRFSCVCVHVCTQVGARGQLHVSFHRNRQLLFIETESQWHLGLWIRLGWLPLSPCLCPLSGWIINTHHHVWFYVGAGDGTRVLTLSWQALCQSSYLPRPSKASLLNNTEAPSKRLNE